MGGQGSEAEGAVVNDSPVDCQSRDLTEPQRDRPPRRWYRWCVQWADRVVRPYGGGRCLPAPTGKTIMNDEIWR